MSSDGATPEQVASAHVHVLRGFGMGALELPQPWVFDGTRRVYTDGQPVSWIARAVDLTGAEKFRTRAPLQIGEGAAPLDATVDLVVNLDTL